MSCASVDFAYLRSIVLEESANVLDASRDYLFESRLQTLLITTGLMTLDRLVAALRHEPDPLLKRSVAEAMTVKETSFFRDRSPFELLRLELLPALIKRRESARRLRLWSAACSSGQEPYSVAMLLREHFPQLDGWEVEITGTDISHEMVSRARGGRYAKMELNRGLPARYRVLYMQQSGDEWDVTANVRRVCRFYQCNLCEGPLPLEKYDGILVRNVMMYFPDESRRQLLRHVHSILQPDGFLILGSSEQPAVPDLFQAELKGNACYYRPLPSGRS
jgi:chemotaxis protein methyltransferase CheR